MKLRLRINNATCHLNLDGENPTLDDLICKIREAVLPNYGLSSDTEFGLSLNGKEPLTETHLPLAECEIVQGDLISVILADHGSSSVPAQDQNNSQLRGSAVSDQQNDLCMESTSQNRKYNLHSDGLEYTGDISTEMELAPDMADQEGEAGLFSPGPMLCSEAEDGQIPHSLETLYYASGCSNPCDAVVVVIHLLMLEMGYEPQQFSNLPAQKTTQMPNGWKAGEIYKFEYLHALCEGSSTLLIAVPMGRFIVVNATQKKNGKFIVSMKKTLLNPLSYINGTGNGENAAGVYKDLQRLSCIFKDQIVYPLLASTRQALDLPDAFGLAVLPLELKLRIFRLLDIQAIVSLSAVNRGLNMATEDPILWRFLYQRDFRDTSTRPRDTDWKDLYKMKYKQKKDKAQFCRFRVFPRPRPQPFPFQPSPFYPFPFSPNLPYPPGILGGEYDERPQLPYSGPGFPFLPGANSDIRQPFRPAFDPFGPQHGNPRGNFTRRHPARSSDIRRGFI
ncbi:F-box only protein 7 isoform X1 [Polypterus senegalus]|uniref:F-box only protein 7 isoform X1 n=1 Tax=Polypterus senegalus TaxID=55291 RepID=UPI001966C095|nr:F-box only protein 7 isoform X1 [Polypterus senegalus]XP_039625430.1 F-box only protein 7 isoform X1 [Polypterus senegalus]XP_039625431.1 F-box only protein 7 isoform X1 [Polypterus senegalus]XP_039625433.1 F-box only protein 7 isoform X1 [Polypterus senegalus]